MSREDVRMAAAVAMLKRQRGEPLSKEDRISLIHEWHCRATDEVAPYVKKGNLKGALQKVLINCGSQLMNLSLRIDCLEASAKAQGINLDSRYYGEPPAGAEAKGPAEAPPAAGVADFATPEIPDEAEVPVLVERFRQAFDAALANLDDEGQQKSAGAPAD